MVCSQKSTRLHWLRGASMMRCRGVGGMFRVVGVCEEESVGMAILMLLGLASICYNQQRPNVVLARFMAGFWPYFEWECMGLGLWRGRS